jgi:predicted transcriptional regulator
VQLLKNLKLVKSVPGPAGGYLPTGLAYETLGFSQETELVPVYLNNKLSNVRLQELQFKPPNNGILYVKGNIQDIKMGDRVNISSEKLLVCGKVVGRDDVSNSLLSSIEVAFFRE